MVQWKYNKFKPYQVDHPTFFIFLFLQCKFCTNGLMVHQVCKIIEDLDTSFTIWSTGKSKEHLCQVNHEKQHNLVIVIRRQNIYEKISKIYYYLHSIL